METSMAIILIYEPEMDIHPLGGTCKSCLFVPNAEDVSIRSVLNVAEK